MAELDLLHWKHTTNTEGRELNNWDVYMKMLFVDGTTASHINQKNDFLYLTPNTQHSPDRGLDRGYGTGKDITWS